jgi:hypothetical protein
MTLVACECSGEFSKHMALVLIIAVIDASRQRLQRRCTRPWLSSMIPALLLRTMTSLPPIILAALLRHPERTQARPTMKQLCRAASQEFVQTHWAAMTSRYSETSCNEHEFIRTATHSPISTSPSSSHEVQLLSQSRQTRRCRPPSCPPCTVLSPPLRGSHGTRPLPCI